MRRKAVAALAVATMLCAFTPKQAVAQFAISEFRFGGSIVDVAAVSKSDAYYYERPGLNAEVLFNPVNIDILNWFEGTDNIYLQHILNPRLHLGTTIALEDNTTSSAYTGLTWHLPVGDILFFEASFGGAVHDGELKLKYLGENKYRRGLGSSILFRESASIGANITENVDIVLQLSHMSHAGLAGDENSGQTDLALKLGWKF